MDADKTSAKFRKTFCYFNEQCSLSKCPSEKTCHNVLHWKGDNTHKEQAVHLPVSKRSNEEIILKFTRLLNKLWVQSQQKTEIALCNNN